MELGHMELGHRRGDFNFIMVFMLFLLLLQFICVVVVVDILILINNYDL